MDSKFALICFLLSSTLFATIQVVQPYDQTNQPNPSRIIGLVSGVLFDKGYHALPLTLNIVFQAMILPALFRNPSTTFTLFCPQDQAFLKPKNPQPPLAQLKYHVVPFKMDKNTMEATSRHGSKLDTLLPSHPLVVTSLPTGTGRYTSLNQVKVTEWDVYNDERLIVHGVKDFFDPAFQTLRYPQYDMMNVKEGSSQGFPGLKGPLEIIGWVLFLAMVVTFTYLLVHSFIFSKKPYKGGLYAPLHN